MMLEPLDGIGDNQNINISVQRDGEIISMHFGEALPPKRLWNVSIFPYDCEEDMQVTELSKLWFLMKINFTSFKYRNLYSVYIRPISTI